MSPLTITLASGTCGPVVALRGEADMTNAPELTAMLNAQVDAGVRCLTVDLSRLAFADSATIGVLISASHALRERHGTMVIAHPQPSVARTLTLLGVDQVIRVYHGTGAAGPDRT